ncbi:unnamed protein product [Prorocentrum cordatum]|uniref:Uncharacterized protein n=1 Tax=Prorocentrum cordatum TaxID=2364126 RepID=A0ABN9WEB4_9DINO|nr:unnamed protein product [Polarella glacialis]
MAKSRTSLWAAASTSRTDAKTFFTMLSESMDKENEVDIGTVVGSCLRIKGVATSIDLQMLRYEARTGRQPESRPSSPSWSTHWWTRASQRAAAPSVQAQLRARAAAAPAARGRGRASGRRRARGHRDRERLLRPFDAVAPRDGHWSTIRVQSGVFLYRRNIPRTGQTYRQVILSSRSSPGS